MYLDPVIAVRNRQILESYSSRRLIDTLIDKEVSYLLTLKELNMKQLLRTISIYGNTVHLKNMKTRSFILNIQDILNEISSKYAEAVFQLRPQELSACKKVKKVLKIVLHQKLNSVARAQKYPKSRLYKIRH